MTEIEFQNMRGMADCMDMVRRELIEAGIIKKEVAPMFIANAVATLVQMQDAAYDEAAKTIAQLSDEVRNLKNEVAHWKANHATEVSRARILKDRPDMPVERVKAYELMGKLRDDNDQLRTELIAAYASRATLFDLCEAIAGALDGPETPLEGLPWGDLVEVAAQVKEEAQRFAIVRAVAKTMVEDGGELALLEAVEKYRDEHGT